MSEYLSTLPHLEIMTLSTALLCGIILMIVAKYMHLPAIAPLLVGGLILGPEGLGIINPSVLGGGIQILIPLAVAIILFEGGLNLNPDGFKSASTMIKRLLTIGVLITWLGSSLATYWLFEMSPLMALLAGSVIIVTGPTVINPLLQRIGVRERLYQILYWEGVLIDPIGVFIAIFCFELLTLGHVASGWALFGKFALRLMLGLALGGFGGWVVFHVIKKKWIPQKYINILVLAIVLFLFSFSDIILTESGLLTVVVMGLILGWLKVPALEGIRAFKSELTEMSIALLFILLVANLSLENFSKMGVNGVVITAIVIFLIRPLGILACSFGTKILWRERIFLSWIAPRGVIAGSMSSLFAIKLQGQEGAWFLESFAFTIITVTILFQGLSASWLTKWLHVKFPPRTGWLIVGANLLGRQIAEKIMQYNRSFCVMLDLNSDLVTKSHQEGFVAICGDALNIHVVPQELMQSIGNVLALTDNRHLNQLICEKWQTHPHQIQAWRWSSHNASSHSKSGLQVWNRLQSPADTSFLLKSQQSQLVMYSPPDSLLQWSDDIPLIHFGSTSVDCCIDSQEKRHGKTLVYQPTHKFLARYVHQDHILQISPDTLLGGFNELLNLAQKEKIDFDLPQLLLSIDSQSCVIAEGNGLMACYAPTQLEIPKCFLAICSNIGKKSQENISLLFLWFASQEEQDQHEAEQFFQALAEQSKLIHDLASVTSLQEALSKLIKM